MERVRTAIPHVQFTTDMIVGFPGETEEEFAESVEFARQAAFLHIHVFPYSKRKGTPAATMKEQIPESVKHERVAILSHVSEETCGAILDEVLASPAPLTVIPETRGDGFVMGHTPDFLEVKVLTSCPLPPCGEITVMPVRREGEILICRMNDSLSVAEDRNE